MNPTFSEIRTVLEHPQPRQMEAAGGISASREILDNLEKYYSVGFEPGIEALVLGAGGRGEFWRSKGAQTLDIDPKTHPDFLADANDMLQAVGANTRDVVLAEAITIDPLAVRGVKIENLVKQCFQVLKPGGCFVFDTALAFADPKDEAITLPEIKKILPLLTESGFSDVRVLSYDLTVFAESLRQAGDNIIAEGLYGDARTIYQALKPN